MPCKKFRERIALKTSEMIVPTVVMALLALDLLLMAYAKGTGQHMEGLKMALRMTLQVLPLLVFAFIVAGMVQILLPREALAKWVGVESGIRGIILGTIAGVTLGMTVALFLHNTGIDISGATESIELPIRSIVYPDPSLISAIKAAIFGLILTLIAAWYPARVAVRLKPAEALRMD